MKIGNTDQTEAALELWIKDRFKLTGADEIHFPSFARMFRHYVDEIRRDFEIDPVTDHRALVDSEDAELGTCRAAIESGMPERFDNYLFARNAQHGSAYAEVFAQKNHIQNDVDRSSVDTYFELNKTSPPSAANLAWTDAHDTCLRLGHNETYAKLCADNLLDHNFSLTLAHDLTAKFFKDFQIGVEHGYSELRATLFAEFQSSKYNGREAASAELFSRVAEEQINHGRPRNNAEQFADYYAQCFDVDGFFDPSKEAQFKDVATIQAEANCRFRYQDGDRDQFISLFQTVANKIPANSEPERLVRFDEVERKLRESYFLSEPDEFSRRRWKLKSQSRTDETSPSV